MSTNKSSAKFFESLYKSTEDPWNFSSSDYELARYHSILNVLKHQHYVRIFEPGCSIGVLTEKIAILADHVDAFDISPTAIKRAKQRCHALPNVSLKCDSITNVIPNHATDLLLLSEIGYYFEKELWRGIVVNLLENCQPSCTLVACHWLGSSEDHILNGKDVHDIIGSIKGLRMEYNEETPNFILNKWIKG